MWRVLIELTKCTSPKQFILITSADCYIFVYLGATNETGILEHRYYSHFGKLKIILIDDLYLVLKFYWTLGHRI